MASQKYLESIRARDAYFRGADKVAKDVTASIGIFGLNHATEKGKKTTNDGYLISQSISVALPDEFERQGALMQHESSTKTNDKVADATSTTIALNAAIRKELIKYLPTELMPISKKSVAQLHKELKKERTFVLEEMKKGLKTLETKEDLINSALVAVEDEDLATLIGETQWELGQDGRIMPEEVNEDTCSVEKIEGILLDNGYASSLTINNPQDQSLTLENGYILLTNHQLREESFGMTYNDKEKKYLPTDSAPIRDLIAMMSQAGMNQLVIMSQASTSKALELIGEITNNTPFQIYAINAPYVNQSQMLLDIESVTGGKAILQEKGSLKDMSLSHLGKFSKMKMRIMGGVISGVPENESKKQARILKLKEELSGEQSFFAKKKLEERIAALSGKLAFLKIGAYVKDDRERLKDKADDAVVSVRNAWKYGTVKGGGLAFKEISEKMDEDSLLKNPLNVIHNQIMSTAPQGFVIEDWVRDPYITLETALINASEGAISMARIGAGAVVTRDVKPREQQYENE